MSAPAKRRRKGAQRRRPFRYLVEYIGLRLIGAVIRILPLEVGSALMGWCWRVAAPRLERHPRALAHLALAYPDKSEEERRRIASDMWANLGRVFAESFVIDKILVAGRVSDDVGALLAGVKDTHRGIVFVSLHSGNWELAITAGLKSGIKAAGVYQRVKNPRVDRYLVESRRERYPRGLFAKGSDVAMKLIRVVRDGGAVAILADLRDRRGAVLPFFGHPAPSTTFPALLARSTGAALIAARVVRNGPVRFTVEAELIDVPRSPDREADIIEGTRRIQARFEAWVREYPDQWMWAHRRWG